MEQKFSRTLFTWLAYLLLAFYGYFLNILGPLAPFFKDELQLSYTVSSLHFTAFAVGMLLVGLGGHLIIRRIGRWRSLWIGAIGMSAGALLLSVGSVAWMTISACFLMGLVGSLILVIVPSALSDQHGEQRAVALSEANVIASFIATAAPLLVGWFAHIPGGWRWALGVVALTPIVMRLGFAKAVLPRSSTSKNEPTHEKLPLPFLYWVYWAAIVLSVSVEFCMISWSADYMETGLGMLKVDAAQAVSLFLGAMIVGRMAGSGLVRRFSVTNVVAGSILVAAAGFLVFWKANGIVMGLAGLFITGLGVAPMYPLVLSLAIGASDNHAVQASARAALASGTAILTLPLVLGRLADAAGIRDAYGVVGVLLVSVFVLTQWAARRPKAEDHLPS